MPTKDVTDLGARPRHDGARSSQECEGRETASAKLVTSRIVLRATRVDRRCVELPVAEQRLDDADIDLLLQKMRGEAVPQRVHGDALAEPRARRGGNAGAAELAVR